jgi:uncharacterized membrane protein
MVQVNEYPMTRQGVRDLDRPAKSSASTQVNVGSTERTLSTIGGTALVGYGLMNGSLWGLLLAAAGGAFIYRGMTGHCPAYAAADINTAR